METFNIKTNCAGQRILFIEHDQIFMNVNDLPKEGYDAMFLDFKYNRPLFKFVQNIRETTEDIMYLTPMYTYSTIERDGDYKLVGELIDEYVNDIDNPLLIESIQSINQIVKTFTIIKQESIYRSIVGIALQIMRYSYSRGKELVPIPNRFSQLGYSRPMVWLFHKDNPSLLLEIYDYFEELYADGYLDGYFVDRVHLCPSCDFGYLNFRETCPKCGSANINASTMIHHFVCANVSPEEEYVHGNTLVCPKCHRLLRHIGVDYDRPSDIYKCNQCSTSFLHPTMTALCFNCGIENSLDKLRSVNVLGYKFNAKSVNFLTRPNLIKMDRQNIFFPGLISHDHLIQQASSQIAFIEDSQSIRQNMIIIRVKVNVQEQQEYMKIDYFEDLLRFVSAKFRLMLDSKYSMAYYENTFYVLFTNESSETVVRMWQRDHALIHKLILEKYGTDIKIKFEYAILEFNKGDNIPAFVSNLSVF
ncbi:MAG: hypothetical protein RR328_00240 [Bacteroidales bacterium]